jgi:hypothetical protein
MLRLLAALAVLFACAVLNSEASAREIGDQYDSISGVGPRSIVTAHHRQHVAKAVKHIHIDKTPPVANVAKSGLVTIETVAKIPITVAASVANKFADLIADLAEHGYMPKEIGCFAHSGHIRASFHYRGLACDIDQISRNRTAKFLYTKEAHAIIKEHGLDDGCDFGDCGHISFGEIGHSGGYHHYHHYAIHRHRHYAGA